MTWQASSHKPALVTQAEGQDPFPHPPSLVGPSLSTSGRGAGAPPADCKAPRRNDGRDARPTREDPHPLKLVGNDEPARRGGEGGAEGVNPCTTWYQDSA